jgi:hypothetical protein
MSESHGDPRLDAAARRWGWHPAGWMVPQRTKPRFWQRMQMRRDAKIKEVFGPFDRDAYWRERDKGQGHEDAGGYLLRCYRAMISIPIEETVPQTILIPMLACPEFPDFATAWAIQTDRGDRLNHQPRCSSVPGWDPISGPGLLCDCGALTAEWRRLKRVAVLG